MSYSPSSSLFTTHSSCIHIHIHSFIQCEKFAWVDEIQREEERTQQPAKALRRLATNKSSIEAYVICITNQHESVFAESGTRGGREGALVTLPLIDEFPARLADWLARAHFAKPKISEKSLSPYLLIFLPALPIPSLSLCLSGELSP